jgi:hypothetical protein
MSILPTVVFGTDSAISETPLRRGVHNAGDVYMSISYGDFGYPYHMFVPSREDRETGDSIPYGAFYPRRSNNRYLYYGDLWIGGVVGDDTLVSQGEVWSQYEIYLARFKEFWPDDATEGGIYRTGRFADDEFVTVYTDTFTDDTLVGRLRHNADSCHVPLGVKVTQSSYSWHDSVYNDFIIVTYSVENIRGELINDGWIGFFVDGFISDTADPYSYPEYLDDFSGVIDTFLYDFDHANRVMIPYIFDNNGDPVENSMWASTSVRGAFSMRLLESSFDASIHNFNWWARGNYGPRRIGTVEDPFREFEGGMMADPRIDRDKYYVMSHPEVDFNQIEVAVHDSSDGWIPCEYPEPGYDTWFLYSFGPFDLAPGDSVTFAVALVFSDNFHVNPDDFAQYFDLESPFEFQNRLDFSEMILQHRRADSVYRSGFTLPRPGPPIGLRIVDYDDDYVHLMWNSSSHPDVSGYYLNVKDTVYHDDFFHVFPDSISDTSYIFSVTNSTHRHFFAVSLVDTTGWESLPSFDISLIPAQPDSPQALTCTLDSLTPILNWQAGNDTGLAAYVVYRAIWEEPFAAYDSTMQTWYRDESAESGVRYNYRVAARHECGVESPPSDSVSVLAMARDRGVLFYIMDYDNVSRIGPYHRSYIDRLYHSLPPVPSIRYQDINDSALSFKEMADFSTIVFISEKRGGRFSPSDIDSIYNYLSQGGKALFIIPNASTDPLANRPPLTLNYGEGTFFKDILKLDSALVNSIVLDGSFLYGDLMGCSPVSAGYPELRADSTKLTGSLIPLEGYIPLAGGLYPTGEVEVLYRYQSSFPDSSFHDLANGVAYSDDTRRWVFYNFPLSLMEEPANIIAFRKAMEYLGVDLSCGDVTDDGWFNVGDVVMLIDYLFRGGTPPDHHRADVNCDGAVDLADALLLINIIFREGPDLNCCPIP